MKKTINDNNQKIKSSKLPKRIDIPLLVIVIILVSFGLVMVLSASTPIAVSSQKSSDFYFIRQCKAAAIGLVLMIFFAFFNYKHFQKFLHQADLQFLYKVLEVDLIIFYHKL